jgi:hypothetical protein
MDSSPAATFGDDKSGAVYNDLQVWTSWIVWAFAQSLF